MENERIEELLRKLKELDPRTRDRIGEEDHYQFDDPARGWMIQGVLQGAAAAKGWHFDVCYNEETTKYISLVAPPDNTAWLDCMISDSPAEALLRAFVAVLEAEAER